MRVLCLTRIFPNAVDPLSAPFNRQQFRALADLCEVEVLATIPWFPGAGLFARWSAAGRQTAVPRVEDIDGLPVVHPRALYVPRVGHGVASWLYAASVFPAVFRRRQVDVILASWAYPDGAAAVELGALLGIPVVVKVHGSDLNVIAKLPGPARRLRRALPRARRVVAVSRALADECAALGVARERIDVVRNGVDGELFHPRDRRAARLRLGLRDVPTVVYVGRLTREKGVAELAAAAARLPEVQFVYVGDGPLRTEVGGLGARPLHEIPDYMAAADVVTLPSWNEGTPNVLLEALACGRRIVATRTGGIPDVVASPALGELVEVRDVDGLTAALRRAVTQAYDPVVVAREGSLGGWRESAAALHASLEKALS